MSRFPEIVLASVVFGLAAANAASAQDASAGEAVFGKCRACHVVGPDAKNRVGPQLNGVVGRAAGSTEGYKYSPALIARAGEGLVWDEANLAAYLENPRGFLKGTKMAFAGLKKPEEVTNVIAYLAGFAEDGSARQASGATGPETTEQTAAAEAGAEPAADQQAPVEAPAAEASAAEPAGEAPVANSEPADTGSGAVLGLGRVATEEEVAAWDTDVRPDGLGLPEGRGTVSAGIGIYDEQCASCHGDFGEAIGRWPVLAGGQGTLENDRPEKTIGSYWPYLSTVYDYVHRAMPFGNARSLSNDDVYALTAYLLYLNDIVDDEDFELSKENFSTIRLPNEQNFVDDDRASEAHYADTSEPCMSDCKPGKAEITMHAAVLDVTPENADEDEAPGGGID